jgi:hypothetical protein
MPLLHIVKTRPTIKQFKVPTLAKIALVYPKYMKKGKKQHLELQTNISYPHHIKIHREICPHHIDLINYLSKPSINYQKLSKSQNRFRTDKTKNSALATLCEAITNILEKSQGTGIFIAIEKIFDSLNRSILIDKLRKLSITGSALKWLKSYLTNRKQIVEIERIKKTM